MDALSISVVESAPLLVAAVRRRAQADTLVPLVTSSPVWTQMETRGMANTGRVVNVFWGDGTHDLLSPDGVDADLGAEILSPFNSDATLSFLRTPAGRAATGHFQGPYEAGVPDVHRAIKAWCVAKGHQLAGPAWEVHTWNEDPALRLADVFYLLA